MGLRQAGQNGYSQYKHMKTVESNEIIDQVICGVIPLSKRVVYAFLWSLRSSVSDACDKLPDCRIHIWRIIERSLNANVSRAVMIYDVVWNVINSKTPSLSVNENRIAMSALVPKATSAM